MSELVRLEHARFEHAARAAIAAKRSPNTRRAYTADVRKWMDFCRSEMIDPAAPALGVTARFRDHLVATLSSESAHRTLAALSSIYRVLLRGGGVRANPFHSSVLAWPVASAIAKTPLVGDQAANAMIAHALACPNQRRGARDAAVLRLLYDTGLRRSSVAIIRRSDCRGSSLETVVKGDKRVEIGLPVTSVTAIAHWLQLAPPSPYLFPTLGGTGGHIDLSTINRIVDRHGAAVGAGDVGPHSFRAAFVTAGYDAGLPEYEIQASAHHADPATTRRYDRHARGRMVATQIAGFRDSKVDPKPNGDG